MRHSFSCVILFICLLITFTGCRSRSENDIDRKPLRQLPGTDNIDLPVEVRSVKLTSSHGLPDNSIRKIFQDSKGFIWFATLNGLSRYDGTRFVNYRKQDKGLSLQDNRIRNIVEDKHGFLWITTTSNMNSCFDLRKDRFVDYTGTGNYKLEFNLMTITDSCGVWFWDGRTGAMHVGYADGVFSSELLGMNELGTNKIKFVAEEAPKTIWIGTDKGLFRWVGGQLKKCFNGLTFFMSGLANGRSFFLTTEGSVFVANNGDVKKVARMSLRIGESITSFIAIKDKVRVFTTKGSFLIDMQSGFVSRGTGQWDIANASVETDNKGGFWIYNKTGTLRMVDGEQVKELKLMSENKLGYIDMERYHIVRGRYGLVWISTYGNGLYVYDPRTGVMQHFTARLDNNSPITSNYLQYMAVDRMGDIWVSGEYSGVSHLLVMNKGVRRIYPEPEAQVDRTNTVRMIHKTREGDIIVGNRAGGVYTYNADMSAIKQTQHFDVNIYAIAKKNGKTWFGTREKGLFVDGHWFRHTDEPQSLARDRVFCMLHDSHGRIWIGTLGGGLHLSVEGKDGSLTFKHYLQGNYNQQEVRYLYEDKHGYIWVGTSAGVFIFDPVKLEKDPNAYYFYNSENSGLTTDEVRFICQDSRGLIWMAMPGGGVAYCKVSGKDYSNIAFNIYSQKDGLVNNMVQAIIEDADGMLWISTEYGISYFNPIARTFENYFFSQYPMGNVYGESSATRLDNGTIVFGSNYGLVLINPQVVDHTYSNVNVSFTDLKIGGLSVHAEDADSPIDGALPYVDRIDLNDKQNSFVIEFSTFDFSDEDDVKYTYKLENYDSEWSNPSTDAYAAYKNLGYGTYKLHVKACNSLGVWSKESTMKIVVHPPFYLSGWAFLTYFILFIIVAYFIIRTMRRMNELRNRIRIEESLTKYKLIFFTNISHEFRTPLTLIQGSLEKIHKSGRIPKDLAYSIRIMDKSTMRMLRLIDQLLEFRKMQNNKLSLSLERIEVVAFLHDIFDSFGNAAESKSITYLFDTDTEKHNMFIDKRHVDKIVYNLLSNAFKYTPTGGNITLSVRTDLDGKKVVLRVTDTGVGIPEEKRKDLFVRFAHSSFSGNSFGIGLHLTHELVSVHKGTIRYDANPEGGSVFTVNLPDDPDVYEKKDFLVEDNILIKEEEQHRKTTSGIIKDDLQSVELPLPAEPLNKRRILFVEDDNDVRDFLASELGAYFEVEAVADGNTALEMAKTSDVDLIVSDVMMPEMDGFELTKKLKNDFGTSHIPIILLTALDSAENHMEGVESGADAYVTKPFSPKLLVMRMFKLIEQRDKLREKFSKDLSAVRPALCSTEHDKDFIDKMTEVIDKEMSSSTFTIDRLAEILGIGRTAFFRKVKGITGYTPNEYIRIMRMKKAAELLLDGQLTVSEISYKVGIDDPLYFSKCFKKQFGVPPSVYQKGKVDTGEKS